REAVKREDPIVVPLWQPHGIFSELDLKFLDDPKKTYGEVEEIYLATRDDFAEDYPEVNEWLSNWSINDDETMAELINFVYDSDEQLVGTIELVSENSNLTDEWMN